MNAPSLTHGMVLAAGLGLRMRPITETIPKPLVPVLGRSLLDRALDRFEAAGIATAVVNTHYLAAQVQAHVAGRTRPRIVISHEAALLETGGGVALALRHLGLAPFAVANSDAIWIDGPVPALRRLLGAWRDAAMDALLLLQPVERGVGYDGAGDFFVDAAGRLRRRGATPHAPYLFTGVQILHPRLFDGAPAGAFSLNVLYDRALARGRLFGLAHDGGWYHVGTPDGLRTVEALLRQIG
ncbi:MAG: nucleotidyltransferase family protein [Alphaproteobacteria bacterium]